MYGGTIRQPQLHLPRVTFFRNNAWHLWEGSDTAPLINLSEINGQPQVQPLFFGEITPSAPWSSKVQAV
jgi:hypothetical protein